MKITDSPSKNSTSLYPFFESLNNNNNNEKNIIFPKIDPSLETLQQDQSFGKNVQSTTNLENSNPQNLTSAPTPQIHLLETQNPPKTLDKTHFSLCKKIINKVNDKYGMAGLLESVFGRPISQRMATEIFEAWLVKNNLFKERTNSDCPEIEFSETTLCSAKMITTGPKRSIKQARKAPLQTSHPHGPQPPSPL